MQPTQIPNTIVIDRASKRKDSCSERVSQFGTAGAASGAFACSGLGPWSGLEKVEAIGNRAHSECDANVARQSVRFPRAPAPMVHAPSSTSVL